MKVEEVQSRSASVVHRNGQNMSAAQTTAAVPGSIASFFGRRAQTTSIWASRCKTRLKPLLSPPLLSHPYGIPPGVVNNLKSHTTTHFITGGTVYTTPPRYTTPGDKIQTQHIITGGVVYPVI